jgi:hypothetical protein
MLDMFGICNGGLLIVLIVIDFELDKEVYSSIFHNYDWKEVKTI